MSVGDAVITFYHMRDLETRPSDRAAGMLHCHLFYEIRIALKGSYEYAFRNKSVRLCEGEMLVIRPGEYHYARVEDSRYREAVCSLFPKKMAENESGHEVYGKFRALLDSLAGVPIKTTHELTKCVAEFLACQEEMTGAKRSGFDGLFREKLAATSLLREFTKCLEDSRAGFDVQNEQKENLPPRVEMKTALLLELMTGACELSLSEMAARLNYSEKHTSRLIKELYGMSFGKYQRTKKLDSIKKMLEDPKISVNRAAQLAGYRSSATLYREFKRSEGMTPLEYREKILKDKDKMQ